MGRGSTTPFEPNVTGMDRCADEYCAREYGQEPGAGHQTEQPGYTDGANDVIIIEFFSCSHKKPPLLLLDRIETRSSGC